MVDVDAVAAELYGLRPEEFTAARDAHAATARKAGQRAEAKRIAALRKPTLAVWAANRLARAEVDQAQHLLELARGLREAHRTLSGEDLRKLSHQQHVVIAAMAGEARRLAGEAGQDLSAGVQREVEQILRSILADPAAADTWARGVLQKAPPPVVGFAEVAPAPGTAPRPQRPEPEREPEPEPDTREAARASREAELAEEALALAETKWEQARTALGALDEQIAQLEERLEHARAERERLAAAAEHTHQEALRAAKRARSAARKPRRR
ncbi:hypothetical protein ACFWFZ_31655 [Streptomyces sp. NPDC060232]|uniref:hypothetical protein n=1 Tax=Streptomyces sp. NPDC060232 TaxID=3347079 RepID=UPI00366A23AC